MKEHKKNSNVFWIYILECDNGNYYTGYTKDLTKRYEQHLAGKANSKYTRSFKPIRIAQCWQLLDTVGTALKIERFIKKQSRVTKELLIQFPANLETKLSRKFSLDFDLKPFDYSNKKPD
ncbi:MAG TPA: GIY-YIG nuclease family protein [bacterium]